MYERVYALSHIRDQHELNLLSQYLAACATTNSESIRNMIFLHFSTLQMGQCRRTELQEQED